MTLVRYQNPLPTFFNRFFDDNYDSLRNFSDTDTTVPLVNIKENTDGFEVEVAAPGFDKEDFNIELDNNLLTITSEKKTEVEEKEDNRFTKREFSYQSFRRSFTLPNTVEMDAIKASYEKGILQINIPKKDEAKPRPVKQIEIA